MELLFLPILLFVAVPPLALLPAAVFGYRAYRRWFGARRGFVRLMVATVVWIAYAVYESSIYAWSQEVVAPIRVDLFLVAPLLYGATIVGITAWRDIAR